MVLVSNPHRFIFLKTSKTASTTAEMALEPACAPPGHQVQEVVETLVSEYGIVGSRMLPCKPPPPPCAEKGTWCNHKAASHVLRDLGAARFNAYTKLTTVRNPFDKCVSAYHWLNKAKVARASGFEQIRDGFRQFIHAREWKNDAQNVFIDGRYIIDRVIRFEQLAHDLNAVANDLGFRIDPAALPHTKSTAQTRKTIPLAEYYDPATIEIVREHMRWVFERYPYPDHPQYAQEGTL